MPDHFVALSPVDVKRLSELIEQRKAEVAAKLAGNYIAKPGAGKLMLNTTIVVPRAVRATGLGVIVDNSALVMASSAVVPYFNISLSTINDITFTGPGQTVDMDQYINDPGQQITTTEFINLDPNIATYNPTTRILTSANGGISTGIQFRITDPYNQVTSNTFFVEVNSNPPIFTPGEPWGYAVGNDQQGISQGGTFIDGGRGKDPIYVTSLDGGTGVGTLRWAFNQVSGGPILFEVGGIITINGKLRNDQANGNQTIWGNTAPGGHANVHGNPGNGGMIECWKSNQIIKHITFRAAPTGIVNLDIVADVYNASIGRTPENVLYEHISGSGWTDGLNDTYQVTGDNYNYYRCLFSFPSVTGHQNEQDAAGHNNGGLVVGAAANNSGRNWTMIECVQAGTKGRPRILNWNNAALLSHLYYMWNGVAHIIDDSNGVWVEGTRYKPQISGAQPPLYNTVLNPPQTNPGDPFNVSNTPNFYIANNDYGGQAAGATSDPRATVYANMILPDGFDDNLDTTFWNDVNLFSNIAIVGANPSTPDSIDDAARSGIINSNYRLVDDNIDIPGGLPTTATIPNRSHAAGGSNALGQSLQQHLEAQTWWPTRHDVMPGYANRTKLEVYLDSFVSGVPT